VQDVVDRGQQELCMLTRDVQNVWRKKEAQNERSKRHIIMSSYQQAYELSLYSQTPERSSCCGMLAQNIPEHLIPIAVPLSFAL
jgi:hypothetical protein